MITDLLSDKEQQLVQFIKDQQSIAIAYSGGVDSTYLAHVAYNTLGKDVAYNRGSTDTYVKTNNLVLDIGSLDYQNLTPNNDPREWQAKSPMRYNLLHSQMMEIQVPCNLELRAGDVIKVEIERQGDDKELGGLDEHTRGKYLILHLCHHFDSK